MLKNGKLHFRAWKTCLRCLAPREPIYFQATSCKPRGDLAMQGLNMLSNMLKLPTPDQTEENQQNIC